MFLPTTSIVVPLLFSLLLVLLYSSSSRDVHYVSAAATAAAARMTTRTDDEEKQQQLRRKGTSTILTRSSGSNSKNDQREEHLHRSTTDNDDDDDDDDDDDEYEYDNDEYEYEYDEYDDDSVKDSEGIPRELKPKEQKQGEKPPCIKKNRVYDVIIVGAGAAGAGAARELYKWNTIRNLKEKKKIKYRILESSTRIGGRIYNVEFGNPSSDVNTEGVWGGFDDTARNYSNTNTYTTPPTNIGCNCQGIDESSSSASSSSSTKTGDDDVQGQPGCERITVEAGAWRFRGDRGIETPCNPETHYEEIVQNENCTDVHPNINRLYALSQGQGRSEDGALESDELLNMRCDAYDAEGSYDETYDGIELDQSRYYDTEYGMELVDTEHQFLPLFNTTTTGIKGTIDDFINELYQSIELCVVPAGVAIYYRWYYNEERYADDYDYSTPAKIGATGINSTNWTVFDQMYSRVPDTSTVEWAYGAKRRKQTEWCKDFNSYVQNYLANDVTMDDPDPEVTKKTKFRARQWNEIYHRWNYDSAYLTDDISFANFWKNEPPWSWTYNTVIDQRGIAPSLIEKIMPKPRSKIRFNTRVTNIDYSGTFCGCQGKVLITAIVTKKKPKKMGKNQKQDDTTTTTPPNYIITKSKKYFCAKKVISTVSVGVMQKRRNLFQPSIQQQAIDGPYIEQGSLIKVFLRFKTKFWKENFMSSYIMTNDFRVNQTDMSVRGNLFYSIDYLIRSNPSVVDDYVRQYDPKTVSTTLLCFISSPDWETTGLKKKKGKLTREFIGEKIWKLLDPLRTEYGDKYVDPNCFFYYNWGSDPNFFGSYPVWAKGVTLVEYEQFYKPLTVGGRNDTKPVVWLSGESACAYHWGTMSGAYEAGSRDSRIIIKELAGDKLATRHGIHTFSACGTQRGTYEDYCLAPPFVSDDDDDNNSDDGEDYYYYEDENSSS